MERDYDTPEGKEGADDEAYMMPMEQRDPMMWISKFWKCHFCLKSIFCLYDAQETYDFEMFKIVITWCETHIRQNVAIFKIVKTWCETHIRQNVAIFKIVITWCETHIRQNVAIFTQMTQNVNIILSLCENLLKHMHKHMMCGNHFRCRKNSLKWLALSIDGVGSLSDE